MTLPPLTRLELSKMIDHSLLKPGITQAETILGCELAIHEQVAAVTIKPCYTKLAAKILSGSGVKVNPVICFPMGYDTTDTKVFATRQAIDEGAEEIDMVLNLGALFSGDYLFVQEDIAAVVEASQGRTVKVILETGYYPDMGLIVKACQIIEAAGGHFVKTSTGFASSPYVNEYGETVGYTLDILKLMRQSVSEAVQVKAAQGVRRLKDALEVIEIGVTRFGVSGTEKLLKEYDEAYG
ncbi:MAG TPA: deoxyribose-phosphate aldolase [Brevefilum sp.]|nr:deoxyribose-phosphate aldolase [Brevefilum sp.]HOR18373.1 deoxyribose-phosphate aldolase [Brevefilum sp.]